MLHLTQMISFELSQDCNLSRLHEGKCPINCIDRTGKPLTDEKIIELALEAYNELGFEGYIMWSIYNEPMLHCARMFDLMYKIKSLIPKSRFLLWTNGTILIKDPALNMFETIIVTNYLNKTYEELAYSFGPKVLWKNNPVLDGRLVYRGEKNFKRCTLPFDNFLISNTGNILLCCIDWKNEIKIGNVFESSLRELDEKRWEKTLNIIGSEMKECAPDTCLHCTFKWELSSFDPIIAGKALEEIKKHVG